MVAQLHTLQMIIGVSTQQTHHLELLLPQMLDSVTSTWIWSAHYYHQKAAGTCSLSSTDLPDGRKQSHIQALVPKLSILHFFKTGYLNMAHQPLLQQTVIPSSNPINSNNSEFLGCKRRRTTAYHTAAKEMVERVHRQLKAALMAHEDPENWFVPKTQFFKKKSTLIFVLILHLFFQLTFSLVEFTHSFG